MTPPAASSGAPPPGRPRWWDTLLYVPLLYGIGWVVSRPLLLAAPGLRLDQVDLVGVTIAFALLLATLPRRLRRLWGEERPWRRLGVVGSPLACLTALLGGVLRAWLLLAGAAALLLLSGQAHWNGRLEAGEALNALALVLGVGFAEELLFRGWLWGELQLQMGTRRALVAQAAIFALLHPWIQVPGLAAISLLGGLVLLGLVLALRRRADGGLLWGDVGLHGGLVGGWFALQAGLLELAPRTPEWLGGSGGAMPVNPIGGLPGWLGLGLLLLVGRRFW